MGTEGVFGYIIGKKKRLIHVQTDANLLWQILTREIYVLMKHYNNSVDDLKQAFEKIKVTKSGNPKPADLEKCQITTDYELLNDGQTSPWYAILKFNQNSFINILETGFIINQTEEYGYVFILDFNKSEVNFYNIDPNTITINKTNTITNKINTINKTNKLNKIILETATLEEIRNFDEMPTKSYTEIVTEMRNAFANYYEHFQKVQEEIEKLHKLKQTVKDQCAANIEEKVDKLFTKKLLERNYAQR